MTAEAFPLYWPEGWPRTPSSRRESDRRFSGRTYGLGMGRVRDQLIDELRRLGARNVVLSSNVALRRDGLPYADQRKLDDPGVAVYFTLKGKQFVMAADRFESVPGNIRSLGLAIEAMRQLERHGGGAMMERAFSGFAALAAPGARHWADVLGIPRDAGSATIREAHRRLILENHPDAGGSSERAGEINAARDAALREIGATA